MTAGDAIGATWQGRVIAHDADALTTTVYSATTLTESIIGALVQLYIIDGTAPPVEEALLRAAAKLLWMPINTESALYKFAQAHNLGQPQTDEIAVVCEGRDFITQVYNMGIVWVEKDVWSNIGWFPKP